jgi:RNA polymerase sigma-70 factor (ECF subfamily)
VSSDPLTDQASLAALQNGDARALDRLVARWQRPLLSFAYRYVQNSADAHDLVASVFVRLYQKRATLRPDTNMSAWLFTALSNLCHNHHRWKRRHPTVSIDASEIADDGRPAGTLLDELAAPQAGPATTLADDEIAQAVRVAVGELPHELKTAILLHHYENLSYRDIAAVARCSERGVETRLYRARQLLRQRLAELIRETTSC